MKRNRKPAGALAARILRKRTGILLAVVLLLIGLILTGEYARIKKINDELDEIRESYALYADLLQEQNTKNEALVATAADLTNRLNEAYGQILEEQGEQQLLEEWKTARLLAGFTEVHGEGIVITLNDAQSGNTLSSQNIIHDSDVRYIVDALRGMGAAAISINGERIMHTSELMCNGPTILINGRYHPVPYVVSAVGDAESMYWFFNEETYLIKRSLEGIQIRIERSGDLTIPGYANTLSIDALINLFEVTGT